MPLRCGFKADDQIYFNNKIGKRSSVNLTFSGPCIVKYPFDISPTRCNITYFIYLWKTALHVSGGISTHHQENTQLYLKYLVLVKPWLLTVAIVEELELVCVCVCVCVRACVRCGCWRKSATAPHSHQFHSSTIATGSSNGSTSTRYCKYSCVCSRWWVEIPPETYRAVFQK